MCCFYVYHGFVGYETKLEAINLRKKSYSYGYISEKLLVSKSTLNGWLSTIEYKPNKEMIERIGKARAKSGEVKSQIKIDSFERASNLAKKDIGSLSKRDLFMLGIGLYMGEGTKSHRIMRVINADPKVIRLAIRWFKEVMGLSTDNFKIRLHIYPDNDVSKSLKYWSKMSSIPLSQFHKVQIDRRANKKSSKRGKLPYGTAHLSILSNGNKEFGTFLLRRILAWTDEVTK